MKVGDVVYCKKTWRGDGSYPWGGKASYIKGEKTTIELLSDDKTEIIIFDNRYNSYDILYTDKEPYFFEYFYTKKDLRKQKLKKIDDQS